MGNTITGMRMTDRRKGALHVRLCELPLYLAHAIARYVFTGAGNGIRTRDPLLGRQMLNQLSYSRIFRCQLPVR